MVCWALKLIVGETKNIIICVLDFAIEGKKDSKTKMDLVLTNQYIGDKMVAGRGFEPLTFGL